MENIISIGELARQLSITVEKAVKLVKDKRIKNIAIGGTIYSVQYIDFWDYISALCNNEKVHDNKHKPLDSTNNYPTDIDLWNFVSNICSNEIDNENKSHITLVSTKNPTVSVIVC